jgi:hypothetical protein
MGKALQNAGYDISSSAIKDVAMDQAMSGFASATISGFAGGMFGDLGSYALGVSDYATAGKVINAALATLAGTSLPGALAAALSPLTALAISSVADALGLRNDETLKDDLEDKYGHLAGRRAYAAAKSKLGEIGAQISELGSLASYGFDSESMTSITGYQPFGVGFVSLDLSSGQITNSLGQVAVGPYGSFMNVGSLSEMAGLVGGSLGNALGDIDSAMDSLGSLGLDTDSLSASWAASAIDAAQEAGWGHGGSSGGGSGWGGMADSGGIGGMGGTTGNTPGGGTGSIGRWTGGPASPGYLYEINERGQELFMPGADGRILNAQETQEMLATLKRIASGGGLNGDLGAALVAIARYCQESSKILKRWDYIGMPEARA